MRVLSLLITLLLTFADVTRCARFLAVLPAASKSHGIWHSALFRVLTQRGHQVVMYSAFPPLSPINNLTYVHLSTGLLDHSNTWTYEEFRQLTTMEYSFGFAAKAMMGFGLEICEDVFKNEKIQDLLQSNEKFDLVFIEPGVVQESLLVFGHKFKAPVINLQGFGTWSLVDWITGNALSVSHIPENLSFPFTNKMSFVERLKNFISTVLTISYYHLDYLPKQQKLVDKYYKDPSVPPITDMLEDISITLANTYKTMEYPRPYTPNVVPIGGAHMSAHTTPLPQNIKEFADGSKKGFIFFSLGTVVPAHVLPKEIIESFVNTFRKLELNVLWKIELDTLPGLSNNVMLTKWVPQPTILAHPNCVLFMTHGGLFSQHETLHAGVPVVGIPFLADQAHNVRFYEHLGVGVLLDFKSITEHSVHTALSTVLNNKRYKENAKRVSRIIHDQPVSPVDSLVFWVEYVMRHNGAPHLKPASAGLPWYALTLLDVIAAVLAASFISLLVLYKCIKLLLKICCGKKGSSVSNKKKIN